MNDEIRSDGAPQSVERPYDDVPDGDTVPARQDYPEGARPSESGGPRSPETTHAGYGEGHPRLIATREDERFEFPLVSDLVRVGGGFDAELRLPDAGDARAEIVHDARDEYVLVPHGQMRLNHEPVAIDTLDGALGQVLRTGAQFSIGEWTVVFMRDEFADHGRPHGGRQGGEFSDQVDQSERPDYTAEAPSRRG